MWHFQYDSINTFDKVTAKSVHGATGLQFLSALKKECTAKKELYLDLPKIVNETHEMLQQPYSRNASAND